MNFFDEWLKRKRAERDPSSMEMDALRNIDKYDREDIERLMDELKPFAAAHDELCETAETGSHLWTDAFFAFAKAMVQLRDGSEMRPPYLINQQVMTEVLQLPEYQRLRTWTEGDLVSSAMACEAIEPDLESLYDRNKTLAEEANQLEQLLEELLEAMVELDATEVGLEMFEQMVEEAEEAEPDDSDEDSDEDDEDEGDDAEGEGEGEGPEGEGDGPEGDGDGPEGHGRGRGRGHGRRVIRQAKADIDKLRKRIADLKGRAERAAGELEKQGQAAAKRGTANLRGAMSKFSDDAEKLNSAARGWGMEPGELQKLNAEERIKLAQRMMNPKLQKIAEQWGAMMPIAAVEQTRKVYHVFEEVYDISIGDDLSRILPSELLSLADPDLEVDFYRRFIDGELLQYEMRGTEKVGKGGIYMCLDNSSSMAGDREIGAKAVGICGLHIAKMQDRQFYGIHFASASQIKTFDFRDTKKITAERVMEYAEHFFSGGTDFETPLAECLKLLTEEFNQFGHVKGDIVFVTDDDCGVSQPFLDHFLAEKERLGFMVWGISISGSTRTLDKFCDNARVVTDLLSAEPVRDIFREL